MVEFQAFGGHWQKGGWGWGSLKGLQRTEKALPGLGGSPEQGEPPEKGVGGPFSFILLPLGAFLAPPRGSF